VGALQRRRRLERPQLACGALIGRQRFVDANLQLRPGQVLGHVEDLAQAHAGPRLRSTAPWMGPQGLDVGYFLGGG